MIEDAKALLTPWYDAIVSAALFALVGFVIAIGKILSSTEPITLRLAIGRCLVTGGIAVAAGAVLALFPDLPLVAQIGMAAALASLGTSGLEAVVKRIFGGVGQ